MRGILAVAAILVVLSGTAALAQSPLFYDPYIVLPGSQGTAGIDVGIENPDVSSIGDVTDVFVTGKYAITDQIEAGARITTGLLNDYRDTFSDVVIGAKYGIGTSGAATANVSVYNEIEEIGLSVGYMHSMQLGSVETCGHLQVGLLDAYAADGVGIDLRVEPKFKVNDMVTAYLDVLFGTNTDDISGWMALNVWPNVDIAVNESLVINAGVTAGIAGDMKQDDIGARVAAIYLLPIK